MIKIQLTVQGMACPKCESRVNDAIRNAFSVREVTSSHRKGTTEVICENHVDASAVKAAVEAAGYTVTAAAVKKKGLFGLWV